MILPTLSVGRRVLLALSEWVTRVIFLPSQNIGNKLASSAALVQKKQISLSLKMITLSAAKTIFAYYKLIIIRSCWSPLVHLPLSSVLISISRRARHPSAPTTTNRAFQPQTTNWRYLQTGDCRNARFLVGDDSEEEEEDEKKDYFSDPESEESEDKSKWVKLLQKCNNLIKYTGPSKKSKSTLSCSFKSNECRFF